MLRIFFNLDGVERWHRQEIEDRLARGAIGATIAQRAASRAEADFSISFGGVDTRQPIATLLRARRDAEFVWDAGDFPAGLNPGLYCSLPAPLHSRRVHRTFGYPVRYNECVQKFELADARRLFSFVGGISSGLRGRMAGFFQRKLDPGVGEFRVQAGPWTSMFDRSRIAVKVDFAESLRNAKFIVCPRGNGVGSIRMFEAMEAQRVPVVLSDRYVLPEGVDWRECAVLVRERDYRMLPEILRRHESNWERMATSARTVWERHFSDTVLLDEMARLLSGLERQVPMRTKAIGVLLRGEGMARRQLPAMRRRIFSAGRRDSAGQ